MSTVEAQPTPTPKPSKTEFIKQGLAVVPSMGYNVLAASIIDKPGVLPKVVAAGLVAKGVGDYLRAADQEPIIAREPRQRMRQNFNDFMQTWADNTEGTSLKDRLKRNIAQDALNFKDKEYQAKFSRMMGSFMMTLGGADMILTGNTNTERIAGAVIGGLAFGDHLQMIPRVQERATDLQQISAQTPLDTSLPQ